MTKNDYYLKKAYEVNDRLLSNLSRFKNKVDIKKISIVSGKNQSKELNDYYNSKDYKQDLFRVAYYNYRSTGSDHKTSEEDAKVFVGYAPDKALSSSDVIGVITKQRRLVK